MHARLGEVFHIAAITGNDTAMLRLEARSMRSFCRSIELCDDYLRGYYGLKLVLTYPIKRTLSLILTLRTDHEQGAATLGESQRYCSLH